jgi:hypothetical protein
VNIAMKIPHLESVDDREQLDCNQPKDYAPSSIVPDRYMP